MTPDLSVFWTIFFVLLMAALLDRLLFKPIMHVMKQRQDAVRSARQLAEAAAAKAKAAAEEFDTKTAAARAEIYQQMDEARRAALARRAELLKNTREETETTLVQATERLDAETAQARAQLERDAEALGVAAAERIVGRRLPSH